MTNKELGIPDGIANQDKWMRAKAVLQTEDENLILAKYKEMAGLVTNDYSFRKEVETVCVELPKQEVGEILPTEEVSNDEVVGTEEVKEDVVEPVIKEVIETPVVEKKTIKGKK